MLKRNSKKMANTSLHFVNTKSLNALSNVLMHSFTCSEVPETKEKHAQHFVHLSCLLSYIIVRLQGFVWEKKTHTLHSFFTMVYNEESTVEKSTMPIYTANQDHIN